MPEFETPQTEIQLPEVPASLMPCGEKVVWTEAPTKLLLSLYEDNKKKVGKCLKFKSKKKLWEYISQELKEKGFVYDPYCVENKWKSLERQYKKTISNNKKTGAQRVSCPYQK